MTSAAVGIDVATVGAPDDLDEFNVWANERRWSDGLPLVPPTPQRVTRMLDATTFDPDTVIATVPPRLAGATVRAIAANAVMAGCAPTAMPILITAVEAAAAPEVNAYGSQATTHPCGLMVMVTGPVASHAGVHGGVGLFGSTFPANVTIGRAMRLILQNVGGAYPGETDRSTQGSPAKISFCFAENEAQSPWEPYRLSRGFDAADSTVTVVFAEAPHNLNDHVSSEPAGLVFMMAQTIATVGKNNSYIRNNDYIVVICPEHAAVLARNGWTRRDLQEYLHERARIPYKSWRLGGMYGMLPQPKFIQAADDEMHIRITDTLDDIHVVVGGGAGVHSSWIPTFGLSRTKTMVVRGPTGSPMRFDPSH